MCHMQLEGQSCSGFENVGQQKSCHMRIDAVLSAVTSDQEDLEDRSKEAAATKIVPSEAVAKADPAQQLQLGQPYLLRWSQLWQSTCNWKHPSSMLSSSGKQSSWCNDNHASYAEPTATLS